MALKNFIKENFVLVLGLTLPLVLIVLFLLATVLPRALATPPQYEMLFTSQEYTSAGAVPYTVDFIVAGDTVIARVVKNTHTAYQQKKLMAYNGKTQSVREIGYDMAQFAHATAASTEMPFQELKGVKVSTSTVSPDGYELSRAGYYRDYGFFPFSSGGYRDMAEIRKGMASFPIPSTTNRRYYGRDIEFIGWIIGNK